MNKQRVFLLLLVSWLVACTADLEPIEVTRVTETAVPPTITLTAISPTATPVLPTATATQTAVPTPTPTITPTPTPFPDLTWANSSNPDYHVAWSMPLDWVELSQQWPPPSDDIVLWQVWANQPEAIHLANESSLVLAKDLMVLFLQIEPAAMPIEPAATSVWEQSIWREELVGEVVLPFTWREQASLWRDPYLYTFSLGCLPANGATEAGLAFCRYVWDVYAFTFGLCAQPGLTIPQPGVWQTVKSDWYGYQFELPAGWYDDSGPTADRVTYFSHAVHQQPYPACPAPEGTMKLEFFADYVNITDGNWTAVDPIAERPTWQYTGVVVDYEQFHTTTKVLAIQGKKSWYYLAFYCNQPWTADCDTVFTHLQNSFVTEP